MNDKNKLYITNLFDTQLSKLLKNYDEYSLDSSKLKNEIIEQFDAIKEFPLLYQVWLERQGISFRKCIVGNYVIVYSVENNDEFAIIYINAFFHQSEDYISKIYL